MLEKDYERKTVLMHAAGAGNSAMFVELFRTMEEVMTPEAVSERHTSNQDIPLWGYRVFLFIGFPRQSRVP